MNIIQVSKENWNKLNRMKLLDESINDVISRLLQQEVGSVEKVYDERDFDKVLEEFQDMQSEIGTLIERSKTSLSKEINN